MPKRFGNLKQKIVSEENILESISNSQKCKANTPGVKLFKRSIEENLDNIFKMLNNSTYKTSKYKIFILNNIKERTVYKLPYYPDRIIHHTLMNVLEPIFKKWFIKNTYSCIKGRGIIKCKNDIEKALNENADLKYCLKLDIKQFYASIDQNILIDAIKTKIKDKWCIDILTEIIKSVESGIPIGNYLSQFFANIYLNKMDHWCKEVLRLKYYYRYCDDIVILSNDKRHLYKVYRQINQRVSFLKLKLKKPKIFPIESGIDFIGYVFHHKYTLLRKRIKMNFKRKFNKYKHDHHKNKKVISSYYGWVMHCDGIHLLKSLIKNMYYEFKKHSFKNNGVRVYKLGRRRKTCVRRK